MTTMMLQMLLASPVAAAPMELVLRSSDAVHLVASYYAPEPGPARGGLLLLPMLGADRSTWAGFAARAAGSGLAIMVLDPRGHGGSGNPYGTAPESWGRAEWEAVVEDARAGVRELEARGVPAARIVAGGASIGASAALHLAASEPSLAGAALLSAGDNPARLPASEALAAYGRRPLFLAAGAGDRPFLDIARRLARGAAGHVELRAASGAGHGTELLAGPEGDALAAALIRFVLDAAAP